MKNVQEPLALKWLEIGTGEWSAITAIDAGGTVKLTTPAKGHRVALVGPAE